MHITISPDGEIHMDTNGSTPAEIASTILSIQRELRKAEAEQQPSSIPVSLNDCQGQTYDWLVANDAEHGVHTSAVARGLGITKEAAHSRMQTLLEMGFVRRVGTGKYRANT